MRGCSGYSDLVRVNNRKKCDRIGGTHLVGLVTSVNYKESARGTLDDPNKNGI